MAGHTVRVRLGGDVTPSWFDITAQVPVWDIESGEALIRAGNSLDGSSGELMVDDDSNVIPATAGTANLAAHTIVEWYDNGPGFDCWLSRGRISHKIAARGTLRTNDPRQWRVEFDDAQQELMGLSLGTAYARGSETDVARVLWALAGFCNGTASTYYNADPAVSDARASTTITSSHFVPNTNTVTMPAKTYGAGTEVLDIFEDCARAAGKIGRVVIHHSTDPSHLCFLYIDELDYDTWAPQMRISDDAADHATAIAGCGSSGAIGSLGVQATLDPVNYPPTVVTSGTGEVERVQMTTTTDVAAGQSIIVLTTQRGSGTNDTAVYDSSGNTYTMVAETIDGDGVPRIWYTNVTTALPAGSTIGYEVADAALGSLEYGGKAISAYAFYDHVSAGAASAGTSGFSDSPVLATVPSADLIVANIVWKGPGPLDFPDSLTEDPAWTPFDNASTSPSAADAQTIYGGFQLSASDDYAGTIDQARDWVTVGATFTLGAGENGDGLATFPPLQDDLQTSEEGQHLAHRVVSLWSGGTVIASLGTAQTESYDYWSRTYNDTASVTAAEATARANSILTDWRYEHVTHTVSVRLRADQLCLVSAGQSIWIKSAAAMGGQYLDTWQQRRVAALQWEPVNPSADGNDAHRFYYAHMQLDRPMKNTGDGGTSSGNQALQQAQTTQANLSAHEAASDPHTGYVKESEFTASGDYLRGTGSGTLEAQKNNFAGTAAPTTGDDANDGYSVASRWVDTTNDKEYVCLDATVGAAVWTETTQAGGGSITVEESDGSPSVSPTSTLVFAAAGFSVTDSGGGTATVANLAGGTALTVQESDGSPSVQPTNVLEFSGATVTDSGGGTALVTVTAGSITAPPYLAPLAGLSRNTNSTVGAANNALYIPAYCPTSATVTGIRVRIEVQSGNIDVGIYDSGGTRLASSGSTGCPAVGIQTISFTASANITSGYYFLAIAADNNTMKFSITNATATSQPGQSRSQGTAFPLPATATMGATESSLAPILIGVISGGWP